MGSSVAGQIRIDIIGNAGGLRVATVEGSQALGSFAEEAERTAGRFHQSQKAIAESIAKERDGWKSAMREVRNEVLPPGWGNSLEGMRWGKLGAENMRHDRALDAEVRRRSMLPFGMSVNSSLSREEAEYAAMAGEQERIARHEGAQRLGRRGLSTVMGEAGLGEFTPLTRLAGPMSAATLGVVGFGAAIALAHSGAKTLGDEIARTRQEAIGLGKTYDQLAAERGMPTHSRFVEGSALSAVGAGESAKVAGAWLWGKAVEYTGNYTGMGRAYGGGDTNMEDVANAARHEEAGALLARRLGEANKQWQAGESSLSKMKDKLAAITDPAMAERAAWIKEFKPTDEQIGKFDELADSVRRATALKEASGMMRTTADAWRTAAYGADKMDDDKYRAQQRAGGRDGYEIETNVRRRQNFRHETESLNRTTQALQSTNIEERLQQALADADLRRQVELDRHRTDANDRYWRLVGKARDDYYREAYGLERKQLDSQLKSEYDLFQEKIAHLREYADVTGKLSPEQRDKITGKWTGDERKRLGISDPLGDYSKDLDEHRKALGGGTINQDEFDHWQTRRRRQAIDEMSRDAPKRAEPVAAMEAGSAASHAVIARAMIQDPQVKLQNDANAILTRLEKGMVGLPDAIRELTRVIKGG